MSATIGTGETITLRRIFDDAGISIRTELAAHPVLSVPIDGYLDKDIIGTLRKLERPKDLAKGEFLIQALYLTQKAGPTGLNTLGELASPPLRNAIVIYSNPHNRMTDGVANETFLTFVHEIAHAIGLHHPVWAGASFYHDASIESWSHVQDVNWCLNPRVAKYLRTTNLAFIRPVGGLSFDFVSLEQVQLFNGDPPDLLTTVPEMWAEKVLSGEQSMGASQMDLRPDQTSPAAELSIDLEKNSYELMESVAANATIINKTDNPIGIPADAIIGGSVYWQVRNLDLDEVVCASRRNGDEYRGDTWTPLSAHREVTSRVDLSADAYGWCFRQPGRYRLEMFEQIENSAWVSAKSAPIQISIPNSKGSKAVVAGVSAILGKDLWRRYGEMYRLGGGPETLGLETQLEQLVLSNRQSPQAPTLAKILVGEFSTPTLMPGQTKRPKPNAKRAAPLERIILTSAGTASAKTKSYIELTDSLSGPDKPQPSIADTDPLVLQTLLLAQFHYKSDIVAAGYASTFGFIGNLLKGHPSMNALLVGHSDFHGSHNANRVMGCRRAVASRNELLAAGARLNQISVATAGDLYPLGADPDQNRRVEIGAVASGGKSLLPPYPKLQACSKVYGDIE